MPALVPTETEHADRSGDGRRLCHDDVGSDSREIATRGGDVAHRDDHRFAGRPYTSHRIGDGVSSGVGTAGRVDTQDDGAHVLGLGGFLQSVDDIL
jgi:hypothetical protein